MRAHIHFVALGHGVKDDFGSFERAVKLLENVWQALSLMPANQVSSARSRMGINRSYWSNLQAFSVRVLQATIKNKNKKANSKQKQTTLKKMQQQAKKKQK